MLEQFVSHAALVGKLKRHQSGKLLGDRKAVLRLCVENIDNVIGTVIDGARENLP